MPASDLFSEHLLQDVPIEREIPDHTLQPRVLLLELLAEIYDTANARLRSITIDMMLKLIERARGSCGKPSARPQPDAAGRRYDIDDAQRE
ncbi:MAG: hypothetical protein KJ025_01845 [Burkholderiales bacterium]|nr:hypothetical protein [Burkholderiales bacterium]